MEFLDNPLFLMIGGAVVLMVVVLTTLKLLYSSKRFKPLPAKKPALAGLPKYIVTLPLESTDLEAELIGKLAACGFREISRDENRVALSRGSALGDISIKIAKLNVIVAMPISNPVQLFVEYGIPFGTAFDTGDLWKFCHELTQRFEAASHPQAAK